MRSQLLAVLMLIASAALNGAYAVMPDEVLKDAILEARARSLSQDLRCLVCQNQSIDDSAAPLARDLRIIVRDRIMAGDTDEAVVEYLTARYGNYVLLKPPFQLDTVALWMGPAIFAGLAGVVLMFYMRRHNPQTDWADTPLTDDERKVLQSFSEDA